MVHGLVGQYGHDLYTFSYVKTLKFLLHNQSQALLEHSLPGLIVNNNGNHHLLVQLATNQVLSELDAKVVSIPGILSLTPPLLTVFVSIALKQVFVALVLGIWLGCCLLYNFNPFVALLRTFDTYFTKAFSPNNGHAQVVTFCFLLGGLIGIVLKGGGAHGLASIVKQFTSTRLRALVAVVLLNFLVFFDDYSAILIVGTTFSRITQELKISKAKFAFIIHGISACFVSLMPISSWVGVEVGYIQGQPALIATQDPFMWFLASIPYRFFPILWLIFIIMTIAIGRDFGPMLRLEKQAFYHRYPTQRRHSRRHYDTEEAHLRLSTDSETFSPVAFTLLSPNPTITDTSALAPSPLTPLNRWYNAAIPFASVALVTFFGMYFDGLASCDEEHPSLMKIFANANSFNALMWGSLAGCLVALALLIAQKILTLHGVMDAWVAGSVIHDVQAATYLSATLGDTINPSLLPAIVSILCFCMSFATGSAFGSMGIMFPLVIPLADRLVAGDHELLKHCVGSILGGCLFGNVLSPIADDTILACMASGLDIATHIESMALYVFMIGGLSLLVGLLVGSLPVGLGWYSAAEGLLLGTILIVAVLFGLGKPIVASHETQRPLLV
ncbi:hypothetical protein THRCLA_11743 [Thraustotheca clavata]|uniref:Na+/H+ antiporter NhaC-like C-terminal domain-containing protein n=1 Tax=Thraustotheca clavata TaxID=74557 RepID=A0A1V9Y6T9_9STRA|nr:hypothetical protein THRCLA_11743 [Thraustotheca clavata]